MVDVDRAGGSTRRDANPKDKLHSERPLERENKSSSMMFMARISSIFRSSGHIPDYMRRGFGSSLVRWGTSVVNEDKLVISWMASPMGLLLYSHLDFKKLGKIHIQAPGETEKVYIEAMELQGRKKELVKYEL